MHWTRFLEESDPRKDDAMNGMGDDEEDGVNEYAISTTVAVTILLLILLTIAFEEGKHSILHSADKNMRPIISSLFGEMTVLGFLSLVTFGVTQLGFVEQLSTRLFGSNEHEALLEILEAVHYMLFAIMVFFVTTVLTLVHGAEQMEEDWLIMDLACRHTDYVERLADKLQRSEGDRTERTPTWRSFLIRSLSTKSNFDLDLKLFYGIRAEFVLERSSLPPFEPTGNNGLDNDFNFGRYLSICLGQTLSHAVELEDRTWAFFCTVTVLYYCLLILSSNNLHIFSWIWVGTGWALILYRNYFDYHIWQVAHALAAPLPVRHPRKGINESESLVMSNLPEWTKYFDHDNAESLNDLRKTSTRSTKQDVLYWKGREGPEYYKVVFQIQLLFTSAYISLLLMILFPYIFQNRLAIEVLIFVIVSVLPFGLMLCSLRRSAANMTIVSNVGVHRRPQTVAQVIREEKTARVIRSVVLMQKLQMAAASPNGLKKRDASMPISVDQTLELDYAGEIFDAMDKSGDGHLRFAELKDLMSALGAPTTERSFQAILVMLDAGQDGSVTKEEFLDFYRQNILSSGDKKNNNAIAKELKELGRRVFRQFDKDQSGTMTLSEFLAVVESFNIGFSIDELVDLINEIDEDNTGSIGEHEFVNLLHKHRHLFQTHHLPQL